LKKYKRATPIRNWLALVRPWLAEYEALPRGERQQFMDKIGSRLAKEFGTKENTLRRFVAAASFLEASGITELSDDSHMPIDAIEVISRISKRDPSRGQKLLRDLAAGEGSTIQNLKKELREGSEGDKKPPQVKSVQHVAGTHLQKLKSKDRARVHLTSYRDWPDAVMFDATAQPGVVISLPRHVRVCVFSDTELKWGMSAQRGKREFLRNVAIASAVYDHVLIFASALYLDMERTVKALLEDCRSRVTIVATIPQAKAVGEIVDRFLAEMEDERVQN
jgi:hypothetical protein